MASLEYMINHVFLPPQLPQDDDSGSTADIPLVQEVGAALDAFQSYLPMQQHQKLDTCARMVKTVLKLRDSGSGLDREKLGKCLEEMKVHDVIAIELRGQNAGLIIRRWNEKIAFESFELSPRTKSVMTTKGRLIRSLPGPAIAIDSKLMTEPSFRVPFAKLLASLDANTAQETIPVSVKAGTHTTEVRDTVRPKLVTEMLTGILRGIGAPFDAIRISKCTRDDVLSDNALKPWRRSPLWLLLRVAIQTTLMNDALSHTQYKSFMIFFMSHILGLALKAAQSSENLFIMAAKISRRVLKLKSLVEEEMPAWMRRVHRIVDDTHRELAKRWDHVQLAPDPLGLQQTWSAAKLSFRKDVLLSLSTLGPYIAAIPKRPALMQDINVHRPNHPARVDQSSSTLPTIGSEADVMHLQDIEAWVAASLSDWVGHNKASHTACTQLANLINAYRCAGLPAYQGDPEDLSSGLLTILSLWVALDTCATHAYPILTKYKPGFPINLFDPLLLRKRKEMQRLFQIEEYIRKRKEGALYSSSFVFRDAKQQSSLGVKFFEQSVTHQNLRGDIETAAAAERSKKKEELQRITKKYKELMNQYNTGVCENNVISWDDDVEAYTYSHASYNCKRCLLEQEAARLQICVHEWPLPDNDLEIKAAVFELDVPEAIAKWRDVSYILLAKTFCPQDYSRRTDGKTWSLKSFAGLRNCVKGPIGQLQLASTTKPFVKSHYQYKLASQATEGNICVNNGLRYDFFDGVAEKWTSNMLDRCSIQTICTLKLPSGSYASLQWALDGTTHTSNEVISKQCSCPRELDQHQYYAFGALRAGHLLQWRNIARELVAGVLNFNHHETYMLLAQSMWQVGPPGKNLYRDGHVDFEEEEFGLSLLSILDNCISAVEGSWQNAVALRVFNTTACLFLSMSPYEQVHRECFKILGRSRKVALDWGREVGQLAHESQNEQEAMAMSMKCFEIFMVCFSTFEVDEEHFSVLLSSSDDVAVATECCMNVCDRCPASKQTLSPMLLTMKRQHEKLARRLEPEVRRLIFLDGIGLDNTAQRVWAGYRQGTRWLSLPKPNERWVTSKTSSQDGYASKTVHYNILSGLLLVDGIPLARLPNAYDSHATYRRIFGGKVLSVVPSTMEGMVFETRTNVCGQQVHFRMVNSDLIIRTRTNLGHIWELLPNDKLNGDFPKAFVDDFAHWFEVNNKKVEWRPIKEPWTSSPAHSYMHPMDGMKFFLINPHGEIQFMIDVRSPTAKAIAQLLGPIEKATHIHILLNFDTDRLEIHLPRMKLHFKLKNPQSALESKQFRGMEIDSDQSFGAFTGLANKIVLRHTTSHTRSVIVPQGAVSVIHQGHHVKVSINTASGEEVKYHTYQIDSQLGRLIDNGSLQSRLFKLYLHATTSHCLVDQLTGLTGTEAALNGLRSASTRSFIDLQPGEVELLESIAKLSPSREYYPVHLKAMQTVHWNDSLPIMSQHNSFFEESKAILDQAESLRLFKEKSEPFTKLKSGNVFLAERAAFRDSSFRVEGFGTGSFAIGSDITYDGDLAGNNSRENRVYRTSSLVNKWATNLTICSRLMSEVESWPGAIGGPEPKQGPELGFSIKWLDEYLDSLRDEWCALHKRLSRSTAADNKYEILILLSTLAYSKDSMQEHVETLLAFATIPALRKLSPPKFSTFHLNEGYRPRKETLVRLIKQKGALRGFHQSPEAQLPKLADEKRHNTDRRRLRMYEVEKEKHVAGFADNLMNQWPTASLVEPTHNTWGKYILYQNAINACQKNFESWHRNSKFQQYIQEIQTALDCLVPSQGTIPQYLVPKSGSSPISRDSHVSFTQLLSAAAPAIDPAPPESFGAWVKREDGRQADRTKLENLLRALSSRCSNVHEKKYAADLESSFRALPEDSGVVLKYPDALVSLLDIHLAGARSQEQKFFESICNVLEGGVHDVVRAAHMLPRISRMTVLSHLTGDKIRDISDDWKACLVDFGCSITKLQRAERLRAAANNHLDLLTELQNPGYQDWSPIRHPEWLLLEIESNILIRQEQAQISREMMTPSGAKNCVMQLNMGLGKSSVIVPIVAASLADSTKLVRVVVLKPLAIQMFQLLAKKVGGILNRRVVYMPVSRSLDLNAAQARTIAQMYKECQATGAIMLLQPEHILSFELMGLDRYLSGDEETGAVLYQTQKWLYDNSRDILDESDEILNVRFELIYTIGNQQAVELSPDRWTIIQNVLGILGDVASDVLRKFPRGLEVSRTRPGSFPRIRFLQAPASDMVMDLVCRHICTYGVSGAAVRNLDAISKQGLPEFLMLPGKALPGFGNMPETTRSSLLLLKGLIGCGVLISAFGQKRWRVNFGLDESRSMLAVPFHAKDVAAARAEFSHPDATIVLTCLSYYYGGLSDRQIRACFEKLLQSDSPQQEYERWVGDAPDLAVRYQVISGINLSNEPQCVRHVFPTLKWSKAIIDFYLSQVVFPAEMKEFPHKLSSSGWDIAREKAHPTTGFSGTNDSRYMLPLSIEQCDLPEQLSTNAFVLDNLLRPENTFEDISQYSETGALDAEVLLNVVLNLKPQVRVIIDVGAQVLELQNEQVAREWLSKIPDPHAQAAIFIDAKNEICVVSRDGIVEPLRISPFATQMDQCLVYLDEAHTRGTDLQLPQDYRAVCTLGPGLTKDRLVQACMRMRKLGKGQSVVFCSSMEVRLQILDICGDTTRSISVADVLLWSVRQTCAYTHRCIPLWATQGVRHQKRGAIDSGIPMTTTLASKLQEPEAQTLIQRYGSAGTSHKDLNIQEEFDAEIRMSRGSELRQIRAKCDEFEIENFNSANLQEEQERELSLENEREQQTELPPAAIPCKHSVHDDVRKLAEHGILARGSRAFRPAFDIFGETSAAAYYDRKAWPNTLLVTADFAQTVKAGTFSLDVFLRPAHWMLSCKAASGFDFVVISPFEAQEILPVIRRKKAARLHVYTPRLSLASRTIEDLTFCAVPVMAQTWGTPSISTELNLFAGQLYLRSYEEYKAMCDLLGLSSNSEDVDVDHDGFVKLKGRHGSSSKGLQACRFTASPVAFLKKMITMRRKGQSVGSSHVGKILDGDLMTEVEIEKR